MAKLVIEPIVRREYGPKQIRETFGDKTDGLSDLCLFPLVGSIYDLLSRDFSKNRQSLGITYWRRKPNQDSIYPWFELVVEGKIVDFEVHSVDIDEKDDDEMIWSIGGIVPSGPEAQVEKIWRFIKETVATYDFNELKAMAAERLKKEKTYHLGSFTRRFYGV